MTDIVQQFIIHGTTRDGRRFRPSDWAERLAGVMSQFRPAGSAGGHLTYSPYVVPTLLDGERCVGVGTRLRELSPLARKRSTERREGREWVSTSRIQGAPYEEKNKT